MIKKCCTCKLELPADRFSKNRSTSDGLSRNCRECKSLQSRKERAKNKARIAETNKRYYDENRDKIREADHAYYLANKDKIIESVNNWIVNNRDKRRIHGDTARKKIKLEVFSNYCDGEIRCRNCGEQDIEVLAIDHVNGNGGDHRREIFGCNGSSAGGSRFYFWLKRNAFPEGFQVLCHNCNWKKRNIEIRPKTPTHSQVVRASYVKKVKLECLEHYGGFECLCGETDIEVLTLDHVNDDGAEHRRNTGTRGYNFYIMLRKNGFPKDKPLQVLCHNCQARKRNLKYVEEKSRQGNDGNGTAGIV